MHNNQRMMKSVKKQNLQFQMSYVSEYTVSMRLKPKKQEKSCKNKSKFFNDCTQYTVSVFIKESDDLSLVTMQLRLRHWP